MTVPGQARTVRPDADPGTDPAAAPALDGATPIVEQPRRSFVEQVMGLPMSVHVRGPLARDDRVARAVEAAFADLRADDAMFSTWKPESPVSRMRRGELRLEDAPERVRRVAALCDEAAERTGGAFSAWLPPAAGARPVFDPTGLVKGWAAEQAFDRLVDRLAALGPHDVLLSAGGDVVVGCARTDTPDWTVGVEDPRMRSRMLLTVPLRRGAVATSGTAARGAHIVDPATGAAPSGLLSATVVGPSLTWADVYATAAFVRGADAAQWASTLADHAVVLVDGRGDVRTVTGPPS
ncbi:FAD:protein FMN transferase [Kineosporia sp. A_224]|uniref:FAD:protein FMN transferase n=1 Tax=Kineosporia sp. A_224 TaxID=1962180 RepID=UPI0018E97D38|nr:FAD:protein FMN transferase [Kineosporia sp. A_224]